MLFFLAIFLSFIPARRAIYAQTFYMTTQNLKWNISPPQKSIISIVKKVQIDAYSTMIRVFTYAEATA